MDDVGKLVERYFPDKNASDIDALVHEVSKRTADGEKWEDVLFDLQFEELVRLKQENLRTAEALREVLQIYDQLPEECAELKEREKLDVLASYGSHLHINPRARPPLNIVQIPLEDTRKMYDKH